MRRVWVGTLKMRCCGIVSFLCVDGMLGRGTYSKFAPRARN
jgi:hypothetical protein